MPVELLRYPPAYVGVGVYRFLHDPKINGPVWRHISVAATKGIMAAAAWAVVSLPLTRLYVRFWLGAAALFRYQQRSQFLGINIYTYTTWLLLAQQASMVLEWFIFKQLRLARSHAYEATVASRGKDASFWGPYIEEWAEPPIERAKRSMQRKSFLEQAGSRWVRIAVNKFLLAPFDFVPFLGLVVSAGLSSVTLGRVLHRPFFVAKKMTAEQEELFIVERLGEYRMFGFTAALLERLPLVGLLFSISNRIGAAMWAHDLEKQQHMYASGELKPSQAYVSKTAQAAADNDLPDAFSGGFPSKKGPVKIEDPQEKAEKEIDVRRAAEGSILESAPVPGEAALKQRRVPPKWEK